jgi:putative endonuclease
MQCVDAGTTSTPVVMLSRSEASLQTAQPQAKLVCRRYADLMQYYVYILANVSRTLYIGITNNLERRVYEHKNKLIPGFTRKYNLTMLVYFETTPDIRAALAREKQMKGWTRDKKLTLIEAENPMWNDLSVDL